VLMVLGPEPMERIYTQPGRYLDDVPRSKCARTLAMRSHFIASKDGQGVWDASIRRGFKAFLEDRSRLLVRAFERQAGMRLFELIEARSLPEAADLHRGLIERPLGACYPRFGRW
jgi:hypothetical protein